MYKFGNYYIEKEKQFGTYVVYKSKFFGLIKKPMARFGHEHLAQCFTGFMDNWLVCFKLCGCTDETRKQMKRLVNEIVDDTFNLL